MEPATNKKSKRGGKIEGRAPLHSEGNRCGHNRLFPSELSFDPIFYVFRKNKPPVLGNLSTNPETEFKRSIDAGIICRELGRAYARPEMLPSFSFHLSKNLDGSPRLSRSEGRACALGLAKAAIAHLDWASMRVGSYNNYTGEFDSRSLAFLGFSSHHAHRDLPQGDNDFDSYKIATITDGFASERVKSASLKLQQAGFWNLGQQLVEYEAVENGVKVKKYASQTYIKTINPEFLLQLPSVSNSMIKRLRKWSVNQRKEKREVAINELQNSLKTTGIYHAPSSVKDLVEHFRAFPRTPSVKRIRAGICLTSEGREMSPTQTLVLAEEVKKLLESDQSPPPESTAPPPQRQSPIADIIQKHLH
jgi:hypothetical protein